MNGWIKLHRCLIDSAVWENSRILKVWIWCLLKATHKDMQTLVGNQIVKLKEGQFIFGRAVAAQQLGIKGSTLWKDMKTLEQLGNISINSNNKYSVVTIEKWAEYQLDAEDCDNSVTTEEQQRDNSVTTEEQQRNTYKNNKNNKNVKNDKNNIYAPAIQEVIDFLNLTLGTSYKATSKKNRQLIIARLNEGFTVDDFKTVIFKKAKQWKNDSRMAAFLRPETLFGTKFEGYLNEVTTDKAMSFAERVMNA